jgi:hypothetical protein
MTRTLFRGALLLTMAWGNGASRCTGDLLVDGAIIAEVAAHIAPAPDMSAISASIATPAT